MHPGSRSRLTERSIPLFPEDTLFHRIARAVCRAGCLPRKELFEAWETARRVRRRFRGGRVVDLAAGHGLLAHVLLILDDSSPNAICVDRLFPPSAAKLSTALAEAWPRLEGRVAHQQGSVEDFEIDRGDLVASVHACGSLTDKVLEKATKARARVAVLPCCHAIAEGGSLAGWIDGSLAIDVMRAVRLEQAGFRVHTATIPAAVTPKNRLLIGDPSSGHPEESAERR